MSIDLTEMAFRAQMRALARKGGAATRRRLAKDPSYYRDIGRLGGLASVASAKSRIAKTAEEAVVGNDSSLMPLEVEPTVPPPEEISYATKLLANLNRRR